MFSVRIMRGGRAVDLPALLAEPLLAGDHGVRPLATGPRGTPVVTDADLAAFPGEVRLAVRDGQDLVGVVEAIPHYDT